MTTPSGAAAGQEREAFEAHISDLFGRGAIERNAETLGYVHVWVGHRWRGWQARAAWGAGRASISPTPDTAAAVPLSDEQADALRFRWLCRHPDWHFIERLCREFVADSSFEFLVALRSVIDARRAIDLDSFDEHRGSSTPSPQSEEPQ